MKLHRIRVTNLNSLYGDHSVDFDVDLSGASLFLIHGPTGAGKSTLLDAVSLALFGSTPRLRSLRNDKAVAEQVMSRGAGLARAEVEFSRRETASSESGRYRAVWKARRAREAPKGGIQQTDRSMERLGAGGCWEVLVSDYRAREYQPVFDRVLDRFTQLDFQRSMLLAQGQFDAMLNAAPEERAAILERLTDTAIYQRLGERASQVAAAWRERKSRLQVRMDAISLVGPEAMDALEVEAAAGGTALDCLDAEIRRVRDGCRWLEVAGTLASGIAAAEAAQATQATLEAAAADGLAALAEHERCAGALLALDERAGAAGRVQENLGELDRVELALPGLQADAAEAGARAEAAEAQKDRADLALAALHSPAAAATRAAGAVLTANSEKERDERALAKAIQDEARAEAKRGEITSKHDLLVGALVQAQSALAARAADEALVDTCREVEPLAAALATERDSVAKDHEHDAARGIKIAQERDALVRERASHDSDCANRIAPLDEAAHAAAASVAALTGESSVGTLQARLDWLLGRKGALNGARNAVRQRGECRVRLALRQNALANARAGRLKGTESLEATQAAQAVATKTVADIEDRLHPLERIAALGTQRAELVDGQACPLCGAQDHPFVQDAAQRAIADAIEEAVQGERRRRDSAILEQTAAVGATVVADKALAVFRATAKAAERELELATSDAERDEDQARNALEGVGLPSDAVADDVDEAEKAVDVESGALRARIDSIKAADEVERTAKQSLADAIAALAAKKVALGNEEARLTQAETERVDRAEKLAARLADLGRKRAALGLRLRPFGIDADPVEAGVGVAIERRKAWEAVSNGARVAGVARDTASAELVAASEALETAKGLRADAVEAVAGRVAALKNARDASEAANDAWSTVWGAATALDDPSAEPRPLADDSPDAKVAFQGNVVAALRRSLDGARQLEGDCVKRVTMAKGQQETLVQTSERLNAELVLKGDALTALLSTLGILDTDSLALRRLLVADVVRWAMRRTELRDERTRLDAAAGGARQQQTQHVRDRPGWLAEDATLQSLHAEIGERDASKDKLQATVNAVRTTLEMARRDAQARAEAQTVFSKAEQDASVWLDLHELIGIGDGKRFKLFAQALNLGQLLNVGNAHLLRLNNRYRLISEPDPANGMPTLEFAIDDGWRPGTVRSLKTLSGGESFIVSLALALGLSDLRTSSMPVETLLLDEGFGTLDPATLETALAALQQLQAGGRQVGIISHVVGLRERIEARVVVEPVGEGRSRVRTEVGTG